MLNKTVTSGYFPLSYTMQTNSLPLFKRGIEGDFQMVGLKATPTLCKISPSPSFEKRGTDFLNQGGINEQ